MKATRESNFGDLLPATPKNPQPLIGHDGKVRPGFEPKFDPESEQSASKS